MDSTTYDVEAIRGRLSIGRSWSPLEDDALALLALVDSYRGTIAALEQENADLTVALRLYSGIVESWQLDDEAKAATTRALRAVKS